MTDSQWLAWDLTNPPTFFLVGTVQVPNPGVDPVLTEKFPQGTPGNLIMVDLHLVQRPGLWPQHVVTKFAEFEKPGVQYDLCDVYLGKNRVAALHVAKL